VAVLIASPNVRRWLGFGPAATLLITTDLDCNWKLDGKQQDQVIHAKESAVVPIPVGQHLIEATATDGPDEFRAMVEIHEAQQYVAAIALDPIRQKRLADEREKARLAEEEQRRVLQRLEQEEKAESARRLAEFNARGWWEDPKTHLYWAANGFSNSSLSDAARACSEWADYGGGWRLPSMNEWKGWKRAEAQAPFGFRTGLYWSSTTDNSGHVWAMRFPTEDALAIDVGTLGVTTECVR
jgi:hypothetical protein